MSSRAEADTAGATLMVVAIAALAVLAPLTALSGIAAADGDRVAEQRADEPPVLEQRSARATGAKGGTYSLRCWQYGRLVFEETGVRVDSSADGSSPRIRATDRHGDPLIVTDTRNATCLLRSERPEPGRGR